MLHNNAFLFCWFELLCISIDNQHLSNTINNSRPHHQTSACSTNVLQEPYQISGVFIEKQRIYFISVLKRRRQKRKSERFNNFFLKRNTLSLKLHLLLLIFYTFGYFFHVSSKWTSLKYFTKERKHLQMTKS